jgi:hypothetical protein
MGRFRACVLSQLADVAEWVSAGRSHVHFDSPGRTEMDPAGLDIERSCLAAIRSRARVGHIEKDLVGLDPVHCSRLKDPGRHIRN